MTFLALVFLLAATVAIWVLPRAWAPVPLLAGACYMTLGQGIEVAGLNFPIIRLLLLAGVVRVLVRGERPAGGLLGMDKLFLAWGAWALVASAFHESPGATFQNHLGMVYNAFCIYFLTAVLLPNRGRPLPIGSGQCLDSGPGCRRDGVRTTDTEKSVCHVRRSSRRAGHTQQPGSLAGTVRPRHSGRDGRVPSASP
jgi:hypothetical protein